MITTFTPTMLATFERCPHQFHRRYVEKHKAPEYFTTDLACGNAAHTALQGVLTFIVGLAAIPPTCVSVLKSAPEFALP